MACDATGNRRREHNNACPNLVLIFWAIAVCALPTYVLSAVLPDIAETLRVPLSQGGAVYAVGPLLGFALLGATAFVVGQTGKEPLFATGLAILAVSMVGLTLVSSFPWFLAWGALMWGAGVITQVMSYSLLAERYPREVVRYQNVAGVFWSAGAVVGPLLAGYLLETKLGWRGAFAVVAAVGLGAMVYLLLLIVRARGDGSVPARAEPAAAPSHVAEAIMSLLRDRDFVLLSLGLLFYLGSEITVTGWISSFLQEVQHASSVVAGLGLSVFWLGMGAGRFLVARFLAQRWSPPRILILAMGGGALAILAACFVPNALLSLLLFGITGLFLAAGFPTLAGFLSTLFPDASGPALSLYLAIGELGAVIFPALAGVVAGRFGFRFGLSLAALLALGLVAVAFRFELVLRRGLRETAGSSHADNDDQLSLSAASDGV
ncbi:MAG: MFS transporter [Limnochordales bacterium]|nr:MFS transporter [Limnochordales bacterium]